MINNLDDRLEEVKVFSFNDRLIDYSVSPSISPSASGVLKKVVIPTRYLGHVAGARNSESCYQRCDPIECDKDGCPCDCFN